jgi:hypothetical protein
MRIRTAIAAGSAVALMGVGGALALTLPAAASGQTASTTLKFTSEQVSVVFYSKTTEAVEHKDVNSKGKVIGFDVLNVTYNPSTGRANALFALDVNGGIMFGGIVLTSSATNKGMVTGGIGDFKGAIGTVTIKSLNKSGTKTAVTITYST